MTFAALDLSFLAGAFPGRLMIGVGHGMTGWLRQAGAWPSSPLTLLTEYLDALRALLAGQAVTTSGRYVTLTDVQLAHPPAVAPMVLAGVRGPKSLAVAGQHADGTILAEPVTPAYVEFARSHIGDTSEHHIVAYNVAVVDDDHRRARERVRAALWWAGEPAWAPEIAPLPFAAELASLRDSRPDRPRSSPRLLPDAWIDQLALVGPPAAVRDRLAGAAGGRLPGIWSWARSATIRSGRSASWPGYLKGPDRDLLRGQALFSSPDRIRTGVTALRGRRPRPLDDGAVRVCRQEHYRLATKQANRRPARLRNEQART